MFISADKKTDHGQRKIMQNWLQNAEHRRMECGMAEGFTIGIRGNRKFLDVFMLIFVGTMGSGQRTRSMAREWSTCRMESKSN